MGQITSTLSKHDESTHFYNCIVITSDSLDISPEISLKHLTDSCHHQLSSVSGKVHLRREIESFSKSFIVVFLQKL